MGRYATEGSGGSFKQAPAGTHVARAIKLIDIGTQHGEYQGEPTVRNQVIVQWELPNEMIDIGGEEKPFIVSKFYTNSLNEKASLRADLEAWRSRAFTPEELAKFDLMAILGKPCMVTVVHNEKGKAKVVSVSAVVKGMTCPPAFNTSEAFWIDEWNDNAFQALPDGFRKLVIASDEYKAAFGNPNDRPDMAPVKAADPDDDIPF